MAEFLEVINGSVQKSGEYWGRAFELLEKEEELRRVETADGESTFLATVSVRPSVSHLSEEAREVLDEEVLKNTFAVAVRAEEDGVYDRRNQAYLIVNDNFANPVLTFNPNVDTLMVLDSFTDLDDSNKYLPLIFEGIANSQYHQARIRESEEEDSRFMRRAAAVVVGVLAVIGSGIYIGQSIYFQNQHEEEQAALDIRNNYDRLNITIPADAVNASESEFVDASVGFFADDIPVPGENETFEHPRDVSLGGSQCRTVTNIDPAEQAVRVITDGENERIVTTVNSAGQVQVCYFGGAPSAQLINKPKVALQVVDKSELGDS